ncbi:MAG: hypothetical protein WAK93_11725 [Solirubrobacteraceae bacterium]
MRSQALCASCIVLALLAGCGGSSSSLTGKVQAPKGYEPYRGPGYSIIVPTGWRRSPYRTDATHSGVEFVTPGPTPVNAAYPFVQTLLSTPTATHSADQDFGDLIADLRSEPTTILPSRQALANSVTISTVKVPNASQARLVTLLGPGQRHEQDLVTLTREGVVELSVAWYPANEPLKPTVVIDSLRLH